MGAAIPEVRRQTESVVASIPQKRRLRNRFRQIVFGSFRRSCQDETVPVARAWGDGKEQYRVRV